MSQVSTVTIANGAATPLSMTFNVVQSQTGNTSPAMWNERTPAIYAAYPKLSMLVARRNASLSSKVTVKLNLPQQDVDGAVNAECFAKVEFIVPDGATIDTRQDLLALVRNFLTTSVVEDAVHTSTPAY